MLAAKLLFAIATLIPFLSVNAQSSKIEVKTYASSSDNQKINLTNEGFMYAVAKPEKFKEIINEKVEGLLIK